MNAVFCLWHDHQLSHDHNRSQALPLSHYWHLYTVLWIPTILCIVNTCIVGVVLLEVIGVVILLHPQATNMPTSSTLRPWVCLHNKNMAASDPCSRSGLTVELVGVLHCQVQSVSGMSLVAWEQSRMTNLYARGWVYAMCRWFQTASIEVGLLMVMWGFCLLSNKGDDVWIVWEQARQVAESRNTVN